VISSSVDVFFTRKYSRSEQMEGDNQRATGQSPGKWLLNRRVCVCVCVCVRACVSRDEVDSHGYLHPQLLHKFVPSKPFPAADWTNLSLR